MKYCSSIVLFLFLSIGSYADNTRYPVFIIDSALRQNANAVIRRDETIFEVIGTTETITKTHFVITILNEKADWMAEFSEVYDKHKEIISMEGILYDAFGKELKKIKKKDTEDRSAVSGGTLISDSRYKRYNFYYKVYPYTVEYNYETRGKSTLFFPVWMTQNSQSLSVESSSMTVIVPDGYKLRYKAFNYTGEPDTSTSKNNQKVYKWAASNVKPVGRESYSPMWHEMATLVILGPSEFQMDDYKGNMVTWQDFGKFVYSLKKGRDVLSPAIKQKVHEIADTIPRIREKIAALYKFMQRNTRYISVQLGIGGWQPFDAQYVSGNGYGDCKALTNYMYSLLKEAGIPSRYTLVRAGKYDSYITEDFPSQQFNHAILCVPLEKDSVWLECTSQTMPPGYLGEFTCDRPVLMIDENGGTLTRTPVYNASQNYLVRKIQATLGEDGVLQLNAVSNYGGLQQDDLHDMIHSLTKDKVKEQLHKDLDFTTYDIKEFSYEEQISSNPQILENLEIQVSDYATVTGKRIFLVPNIMSRSKTRVQNDTSRKYDILIHYSYKDVDSVEINLPGGYTAEALPPPTSISSIYGQYGSSVKKEGNKLVYYRKMEITNGRFPAGTYGDFVKFYDAVYKADRSKIVLTKTM